jgi:hypothetical protein
MKPYLSVVSKKMGVINTSTLLMAALTVAASSAFAPGGTLPTTVSLRPWRISTSTTPSHWRRQVCANERILRKATSGAEEEEGKKGIDPRTIIFGGGVPAIIFAFQAQLIADNSQDGLDIMLAFGLPVAFAALLGVVIGIGWVRAESRGVAFFSAERAAKGGDQSIGANGEGSTGYGPPIGLIVASVGVLTFIANLDDRFNAFAR